MTLVILPEEYRSHKVIAPQPIHSVDISADEITLGESFTVEVNMNNRNDFADILLTSVGFPRLLELGDSVDVIGYDYTQSPKFIDVGSEVDSDYIYGNTVPALYPSIEADSRNVKSDASFRMVVLVTPQKAGEFEVYVKTMAIPHTNDLGHYPHSGLIDPQGEFVDVYVVTVKP